MTPLPALVFGVVLGMRHATDADHIAAVTALAAGGGSAQRAAFVGAWWGVGHSASVLLVGGVLVALRLPMPARVALALEFLAALMLVGLGVRSLVARHRTDPTAAIRPFAVGVVHGLAGTAVLALLVLGATASAAAAAAYLVSFSVGTIAGMTLVSSLVAVPARLASGSALRMERGIRLAAGAASVAIGLAMAHRVGVRDGLFAATPVWTPE